MTADTSVPLERDNAEAGSIALPPYVDTTPARPVIEIKAPDGWPTSHRHE